MLTIMIIGIVVMVLVTFSIEKIIKINTDLKSEYEKSEKTIEEYEDKINRCDFWEEVVFENKFYDYEKQSRTFFGNTDIYKEGENGFYKFHINLNNKNIEYIERNFTEISYFKSMNRENLINDLLKEEN